jgi:protein-disulfide isomerase
VIKEALLLGRHFLLPLGERARVRGETKESKLKFILSFFTLVSLVTILFPTFQAMAQEDRIVQVAIDTVKTQLHLPKQVEVRFIKKQQSPIPDFYSVKLLLFAPDREIPVVVYVDKTGEKVFIGNLFIKGENVTLKEAGVPRVRSVSLGRLEIEKSPVRGPFEAKVTVVEFSNFECPYCQMSWMKVQEWMEKHPEDIRYVFKHFPFQSQGKAFDLSEMAAAAQKISNEAFWVVHDFLFSNEGQVVVHGEKNGIKQKIEQILKEKGHDAKSFQVALETGRGRKKVEEDMALGKSIQVMGTPTVLMNGEFVSNPVTDQVLEKYLRK